MIIDITTVFALISSSGAAIAMILISIAAKNTTPLLRVAYAAGGAVCLVFAVGYALILFHVSFDTAVWFRPLTTPIFTVLTILATYEYMRDKRTDTYNDVLKINTDISNEIEKLRKLITESSTRE